MPPEDSAKQVKEAHGDKERVEADFVGGHPNQKGEQEAGDPRRRAAHAVDRRHLAFVERLHDQRAKHAGDDLVPEAADGDQHDGDIRVAGHGHDGQRNHQKRAGDGAGYHRVDAGAAKPAGVEPGEVAARHAAEVGGGERQPGEHRDLLQIHTVLFGEVQRHPEAQHGSKPVPP